MACLHMGVENPLQAQAMARDFGEVAVRVGEHGINYRCFTRKCAPKAELTIRLVQI